MKTATSHPNERANAESGDARQTTRTRTSDHHAVNFLPPLNAQLALPMTPPITPAAPAYGTAKELCIQTLREQPIPAALLLADTPQTAANYWRETVAKRPGHNPEVENFVVLFLNTRRRVKGHQVISQGTADTLLVHPREVFRLAILASASALVVMHNHPSGEATPSEADIKVTRDLIRAGQLLKIEVLDHVIVGNQQHSSLRELGYFF